MKRVFILLIIVLLFGCSDWGMWVGKPVPLKLPKGTENIITLKYPIKYKMGKGFKGTFYTRTYYLSGEDCVWFKNIGDKQVIIVPISNLAGIVKLEGISSVEGSNEKE